MSLVLISVLTALAQPGDDRLWLGSLIAIPEVQKEIGLSEDKAAVLNDDLAELRLQRPLREILGNIQNLRGEERQKRIEAMNKELAETAQRIDEKIMSAVTETQWNRLNELVLQQQGAAALKREDIAAKLNLSAEQKEKIKGLAADLTPRYPGRLGIGLVATIKEMLARREKATTEALAVLTFEQKKQWESMQGAKFEFPPMGR